MRRLKIFEKYIKNIRNEDLKMGKFIILKIEDTDIHNTLLNFINSNVGIIADNEISNGYTTVKYHNVNDNIRDIAKKFKSFYISIDDKYLYVHRVDANSEVEYLGDNEEELEIILQTKKYNI